VPGHYRATRRFWVGSCREDDLVGRQLSWSDCRTLVGPQSAESRLKIESSCVTPRIALRPPVISMSAYADQPALAEARDQLPDMILSADAKSRIALVSHLRKSGSVRPRRAGGLTQSLVCDGNRALPAIDLARYQSFITAPPMAIIRYQRGMRRHGYRVSHDLAGPNPGSAGNPTTARR
jgi:hypothetical protein